jgi:hypothetical protein
LKRTAGDAILCGTVQSEGLGVAGLEPAATTTNQNSHLRDSAKARVAESGAVVAESAAVDADLPAVVRAWLALSSEDQAAVLAIIRRVSGR